MENVKVERITLEDGRQAERRVTETAGERVIEIHCEPERPKLLTQRIVEKKQPVVVERTIETVKDGQVVEQKVESIQPKAELQLRSVIKRKAAKHEQPQPKLSDAVTRKELMESIVAAVKLVQKPDMSSVVPVTKYTAEQEVGERVAAGDKSRTTYGLGGLILALVGGMGYVLFGM